MTAAFLGPGVSLRPKRQANRNALEGIRKGMYERCVVGTRAAARRGGENFPLKVQRGLRFDALAFGAIMEMPLANREELLMPN